MPSLIIENRAEDPRVVAAAIAVNWIVWLGFCGEYLIKLALAPARGAFVRRAWFDLLLIVLSPPFLVPDPMQASRGVRGLRALRLLRVLRAVAVAGIGLRLLRVLLSRHRFQYVLAFAVATVALGALAVYAVEGASNPAVGSIGNALWWSVVTTTTVGYGDVSPITAEGRIIAVFLMVTGIGVIGMFTATVASLFFEQGAESDTARIEARLSALEEKIDALIVESRRCHDEDKRQP